MSTNDIPITIAQRRNLLNLQRTSLLQERTEGRLSSGRKVATILDDPVVFYRARTLTDLASDFNGYQQEIDQSLSAVTTFSEAIETTESLLKQMKGLAESQRNNSTIERRAAIDQFRSLGQQLLDIAQDVSFQGVQLLTNSATDLTVRLAKRTASILQIDSYEYVRNSANYGTAAEFQAGLDRAIFSVSYIVYDGNRQNVFRHSALYTYDTFTAIGLNNSQVADLNQLITRIDNSIDRVRGHARQFASYASILQLRLQFTRDYTNELTGGADKLVLADLNEEGANLTALQTRQQLGIQTLRFATQQQQSILQLLRQ
ncbi:MAG: hypothetical protein AAF352_04080 [Pseudomonadota bacterium]